MVLFYSLSGKVIRTAAALIKELKYPQSSNRSSKVLCPSNLNCITVSGGVGSETTGSNLPPLT